MIIRLFRGRIDSTKRSEFENKFLNISVKLVKSQYGIISVDVGKPSKWTPDEYVMISRWESVESLRMFTGDSWNEAHIPEGMSEFILESWVHHYFDFD